MSTHEHPRHDYATLIAGWMNRPEALEDDGISATERIGFMRSSMESVMRESGADDAEVAREMAYFDAAAKAQLAGGPAARSSTYRPAARTPAPTKPLGLLRWIAVVYLSGGIAAGAGGSLFVILQPLIDAGRLGLIPAGAAAFVLAVIVGSAAIPAMADTVRRYRGVGFMLFWLPVILFVMALVNFPPLLLKEFTVSMGADFLPLALPLAGALFAALALPAIWLVARRLTARAKPLPQAGDSGDIHPVMALFLTGFSILFFDIGAEKMLGWGPGPALAAGLLVTGLIARIFRDREIGLGFLLAVALPLSVLAAEMPASGLSALTILVLALAAALVTMTLLRLRGQRRTAFFSGLTAAALALLLVIAPTGPAPAMRLSQALGHPLRPLAEAVMQGYADLYRTEFGHAVLAVVGGFRSGAAAVRADDYGYDPVRRRYAVTLDVLNTGEQGIERIQFRLAEGQETGDAACGSPEIEHRFAQPLWPGDRALLALEWVVPANCPSEAVTALARRISDDIRAQGWENRIANRVLATRPADPAERFRQDAHAWLDL